MSASYKCLILILFGFGLSLNLAQAQLASPCVDKKMSVDFSCSCKASNTCYKSISKIDKQVFQHGVKTPRDKKLFNIVKKAYDLEDDLLAGKVDITNDRFAKLDTMNAKLSKLNKKKRALYEKATKASGAKKWKLEDRQKAITKLWSKMIPKERWDYINKHGIGVSLASEMAKSMGAANINVKDVGVASKASIDDMVKQQMADIKNGNKESNNPKVTDDMGTKDVIAAAREAEENLKNKKYKVNDIHASHVDIWKAISGRYIRVTNRLDQDAILLGSKSIDQNSVKKGILHQLNMM